MSFKSTQTLPTQSLTAQPILGRVSPAKARKLENVMRGTGGSHHGITQIGFGTNAPSVDVDELYPMVSIVSICVSTSEITPYTILSPLTHALCHETGNIQISS